MARLAYLDCFAGISGDMLLGALLHAGLPLADLRAELARLSLDGYERFVETRSVDVHVGRLRARLGAAGRQIETVIGLGYRFID